MPNPSVWRRQQNENPPLAVGFLFSALAGSQTSALHLIVVNIRACLRR
jgi:hypothetical protein